MKLYASLLVCFICSFSFIQASSSAAAAQAAAASLAVSHPATAIAAANAPAATQPEGVMITMYAVSAGSKTILAEQFQQFDASAARSALAEYEKIHAEELAHQRQDLAHYERAIDETITDRLKQSRMIAQKRMDKGESLMNQLSEDVDRYLAGVDRLLKKKRSDTKAGDVQSSEALVLAYERNATLTEERDHWKGRYVHYKDGYIYYKKKAEEYEAYKQKAEEYTTLLTRHGILLPGSSRSSSLSSLAGAPGTSGTRSNSSSVSSAAAAAAASAVVASSVASSSSSSSSSTSTTSSAPATSGGPGLIARLFNKKPSTGTS